MQKIMLWIFVILAAALPLAAQAREESGLIRTANGYLVVWNEPGNYYTIEIRGRDIKPIPDHQLWFTIDGKFFQIVTPSTSEFVKAAAGAKIDDRQVLTAHRDWESDYISQTLRAKFKVDSTWQKLANGTDALAWSFDMPKVAEKQTAKRQLYLAVVKGDHVLALNTVVETDGEENALWQLLTDTMNRLKPSDKPLSLEKASEMVKKGN